MGGLGDPLANGRSGFGFGAHDGAVAVEFLVELPDSLPDLPFLCFLVGVGLGGIGKLGASVVEVLIGEQLGQRTSTTGLGRLSARPTTFLGLPDAGCGTVEKWVEKRCHDSERFVERQRRVQE